MLPLINFYKMFNLTHCEIFWQLKLCTKTKPSFLYPTQQLLFASAPLMKSYLLFVTTIALVPPPFCQPANDMTQWPSCQPIKACILMKSDLKQWIKFLFHICFPNSNLLLIMLRLSALAKKFEWKYICFFLSFA